MAGATTFTPSASLQALCLESSKKAGRCWLGSPALSLSSASSSLSGEAGKLGLSVSRGGFFKGQRCPAAAVKSTVSFHRDGLVKGLEDLDSSFAAKGSKGLHTQGGYQSSAVVTADYVVADEEAAGRFTASRGGLLAYGSQENDSQFLQTFEDEQVSSQADGNEKDQLAIANLGISEEIVKALADRGIERLFPIQRAVLEPAMQGKDLIGRAKTGTGKTLAFGIPILHRITVENQENRLARRAGRSPRSLVLAPTRELAKQVEREFKESAPHLSTCCVYGGVSAMDQKRALDRGVDIVVGTPGRVIDLMEQGSLRLQDCRFLVLDEADQMLSFGFAEDVEKILETLPTNRQSMMFSATMPPWVVKLSRKFLKNAQTIDLVGEKDEKLAEGIKIMAISVGMTAKRAVLNDLITVYGKGKKTIVFTQTKRDADEVSMVMSRMIGCEALHGDISQHQREKTLNGFRTGIFSVLVATDVAARGLDIPNVDLVVHYEAPNDSETFVHRSGRTGRAGKAGTAILMYSGQQQRTLRTIEHDVGCKFQYISAPSLHEVLQACGDQAAEAIRKVHPDLTTHFVETAEKLLGDQGVGAFAAAIAHISGYTQPPPPRSLITQEEGKVTLRLVRTGRARPSLTSARVVTATVSSIFPEAAYQLGKIRLIANVDGAVFDVPAELSKAFLSKQTDAGDVIDMPKVLPQLEDDDDDFRGRDRDNFGRFSRDGGFSGRSSRGGRGGGDRYGSRSDGYGGGGRRGGDDFGSGRSRDSGFRVRSDSYGGRSDSYGGRSDRGSSGGGGSFGGTCYVCGQAGHRAADCPSGSSRR